MTTVQRKKKTPSTPDEKLVAAKRPTKAPGQKSAKKRARSRTKLKRDAIEAVFSKFHEIEPEPKGELEHVNPFTLVVAVLLSAQATDAGVNKATRPLFAIADTPEQMLALGEDKVRDYVKTIGLYRNKAKNVILMCEKLINEHGGQVPADRDALEQLPGVGRKTANVVMNMAFGEPTMAVDTHVFRVSNRMGLSSGKDPLQVEEDLVKIIPEAYGLHAHHWLILHGRYLCKARTPECWRCPVAEHCLFKDKTPAPDSAEAKQAKANKAASSKKKPAKKPVTRKTTKQS